MNNTRIVELFIDDEFDESGIEAISLVSRPAHDETWMAFNQQVEPVETMSPYKIVEDDFCSHNPQLSTLGEPYSHLINEGWEVVRAEKITPQMVHKMNEQRFSAPNDPSELDTDEMRVRFKYVGPRDERNRQFCSDMMSMNRVYRMEDIDNLTNTLANSSFGFYDIFLYRGSFNCRHQWYRLFYKPTGQIRNSANSTKGLTGEEGLGPELQPDTRPEPTIRNVGQPDSDQWRPGTPRQGSFKKKTRYELAQDKGLEDACWEGYEAIGLKPDGSPNCVPIEMTKDDFADTISDYPQGVKDAAKRALDWANKNGWGSCGTGVGKVRANQLAKGENISVDTVKRMYSYLSRHKGDLKSSKSFDEGCGYLMFMAWGGEAGLTWSERKLGQIEKEMSKQPKKAVTMKDMSKWGGMVKETKKLLFYDEEKQVVVGAAMVPNKMIHRYDELGNMYYVYFSKKSIKRMADKFLRQKRTDETSIEHNGIKLGSDKVYVTESWVSEDPIKDKSAAYGFNLPSGTWFVSMKVEDPKVWKLIKSGALTGFSVEGLFAEKSVFSKQEKQINQIKQILKSIKDEQ
jgi:hypothetical protein